MGDSVNGESDSGEHPVVCRGRLGSDTQFMLSITDTSIYGRCQNEHSAYPEQLPSNESHMHLSRYRSLLRNVAGGFIAPWALTLYMALTAIRVEYYNDHMHSNQYMLLALGIAFWPALGIAWGVGKWCVTQTLKTRHEMSGARALA